MPRTVLSFLPRWSWALLGGALFLGGADGGCGALAANSAPLAFGATAGGVRWVGADPRPLAVGSQASLGFEVGAGVACCQDGYRLSSSAPGIIDVHDEGDQTLSVQALGAGAAQLELFGAGDGGPVATLPLVAADATSVTFADPSHQAAGIPGDTALPPAFSLLRSGTETIAAAIVDAAGETLASQGLTSGHGLGAVAAVKVEPEQFILTALPTSAEGEFVGGLTAEPASTLTYQIALVDQPAKIVLEQRTSAAADVMVLAKALAADGTEVLGLSGWAFRVGVPGTVVQLASSAVRVTFPDGTPAGSVILTASIQGGLSAQLALP